MNWRLSKKAIISIHVLFLIIFVVGLIMNNYTSSKVAGVCFQVVAFLYSAGAFYIKLLFDDEKNRNDVPTIYFTDRQQTITHVIERLYTILFEHSEDKIITILCDDTPGCGKTELLLKIAQVISNDKIAHQILNQNSYKKYRRIKRKLGQVNFYQYRNEHSIGKINQSPCIVGKSNIIIVDDLPSFSINRFNEHFIIIFCKQSEKEELSQKTVIKLEDFNENDVKMLFKEKFSETIDDVFLKNIMSYSKGNIAIISAILADQSSIRVFKHSAPVLFEIEHYINSGNYRKARSIIDNLSATKRSMIENDAELNFRLRFLNADLLHLENHYEEALEHIENLRIENLNDNEKQMIVAEKISHIKKHMGEFKEAIAEIDFLPDSIKTFKCLSLNLLAYCQYEEKKYLDEANNLLYRIEQIEIKEYDEHKDSFNTYRAVTAAYDQKYDTAHKMIRKAINMYLENDSKFLNNCYFIEAEIYRHQKMYSLALKYYQKCLDAYRFNGDFDIYSLAYVMIKYINLIKNYKYEFDEVYSLEEIKEKCDNLKMSYNKKLSMYLSQLLMEKKYGNKKQEEKIIRYFDTHIFVIP